MKIAVKRPALHASALAAAICAFAGVARADSGTDLRFDIGLRAEQDSNPDLSPAGSAASTTGGLDLSFGLTSETALSTLSLQGSAGLLAGGDTGSAGLADPRLDLTYLRTTANAQLTLKAGVQDSDVTDGDITNFDTGAGQRSTADLSAGLSLGTGGPLGFGLTAGLRDLAYRNTTDPALLDATTTTLGVTLRRDLSQVLHANLGLNARRFDQDGAALRETQSLDLGLTLDRPTGGLSFTITGDDTPDGQRLGARFEQRVDLATGQLTYSLGATRGVSDKTYGTGALRYAQELPTGTISIALSQAVQPGADTDAETLLSTTTFAYNRAVTTTANLGLSLNWAQQNDTTTDSITANTNLSATWTQNLTPDWALDLGYTHRLRDQDGLGQAESDTVSIEFRRAFSLRF